MTTTDIVPVDSNGSISVPSTWEASWRLAQRIASTPFVPGALRGRPESVLAAVLYGAELNLGPMQSLASIHVIDGRPAAAPELMRALVARAGHRITVVENTDDAVTLDGQRADTGATARVTWSMADAQRAGLLGKGAWKTYPRAMLLARATSELARMLFADVIAGLSYTPEKVASIGTANWDDVEPDAAPIGELPDESDPALETFQRVRAAAGTPAAVELRALGADRGRRLTASDFNAYPEWRNEVNARLDELLAEADIEPADVIDQAPIDDTAIAIALHTRVVAAAGTATGDQLVSLSEKSGRILSVDDFIAFPGWASIVAEILDTATTPQSVDGV